MTQDGKYFKKLLELVQALSDGLTEDLEDEYDLEWDLEELLVKHWSPSTIGDIRGMPFMLWRDAIKLLIERDGGAHYDRMDLVLIGRRVDDIVKSCKPTDGGLEICEWITANVPLEPELAEVNCLGI